MGVYYCTFGRGLVFDSLSKGAGIYPEVPRLLVQGICHIEGHSCGYCYL